MISLSHLRNLGLHEASRPGRPAHVSAASGLVRVRDWLYVIADDENHLAFFSADGAQPGTLIRIFPGTLPVASDARKRNKPDVEAIVMLPPAATHPHGALLLLGSGSKRGRCSGVLLVLDAQGALGGSRVEIDLAPLYGAIESRFGTLNIEGAAILEDELVLLQRGNKGDRRNARVRLKLAHAVEAIVARHALEAASLIGIQEVDLGAVGGIPLSFTDASALPDGRLLFSAVAEDSGDSYEDGTCSGAALGILGADGRVERIDPVDPCLKVEGISARVEGSAIRALLVTDADNPEIPAVLLACEIPLGS